MNHIPAEVLQEIFSRLELKDKLTCILVCRFWYNTLDHFNLIDDLYIKNTQFHKFKSMLERFPHRATQVEYLRLNGCLEPTFDKRELCNLFPNLRQLFSIEPEFEEPQVYMSGPIQFLHATCKLEEISESGQCKLVPHLAMSNMCNNLKLLSLKCYSIESDMISQLRNMPVLEKLWLNGACFNLMDLEILHSNLPTLKRLTLVNVHLLSGEIPQNIVPASLLTLIVEIASTDNPDAHIQFYKYCGNKYPSVTHPYFNDDALPDEDRRNIPRIYNEGVFALYQKLGSHVNTFALNNYCEGLDAFRKFDEFGMHLMELTISVISDTDEPPFIEELVQSQQFKYIKKLKLENIVPEFMPMMNNMEALETLRIFSNYFFGYYGYSVRKPINFTQLINACPTTLTRLYLEDMNLIYDGLTTNITGITDLTITNVELTPLLANIIETSFPKLSTLRFKGDITGDVTISLLKHNLDYVTIIALCDKEDIKEYKSETKFEEGMRCHMLKRVPNKAGQLNSRDNPASVQEPGPSFTLKFICPSVRQLYISTEKKPERHL